MKVSDLSGRQLDYWVERARWPNDDASRWPYGTKELAQYSTDWSAGGPVIEIGRIVFLCVDSDVWIAVAAADFTGDQFRYFQIDTEPAHRGVTPLIAAMRCYVATVFGEHVADEAPPSGSDENVSG